MRAQAKPNEDTTTSAMELMREVQRLKAENAMLREVQQVGWGMREHGGCSAARLSAPLVLRKGACLGAAPMNSLLAS